jgi:hypothetical protein
MKMHRRTVERISERMSKQIILISQTMTPMTSSYYCATAELVRCFPVTQKIPSQQFATTKRAATVSADILAHADTARYHTRYIR